MTCPTCGTANEAGSRFCNECGTRLSFTCASCGTANGPGAKFCRECGAALGGATGVPAAGSAAAPSGSPDPSSDVPAQRDQRQPTTERRRVSVLFADLVGFTTAAEDRDPEAVRELLDAYYAACAAAVRDHGGTIEKFIGDAVMAVWGAPVAHEDDAERAVRAALELVDAVGGIELRGRADKPPETLRARAAVATGEAAVNVGAADQALVAGDLVNTASRLQSVAPPGGVLVADATRLATGGAVEFEPLGTHELKGKSVPVASWRAVRVVSRAGDDGRDSVEPPFVGRDAELRLLKELYQATAGEHRARLVSITGTAGIGKSRLAIELGKYLDGIVGTVLWHQGRSPAYGQGVTYWALGEMVRRRAGIAETDDARESLEKLRATVADHVPDADERRWIEPRLAGLLALGDPPSGAPEELFAAWRRFFELLATEAPVVMVFEDLHWADAALFDFIESIVTWSRGHRILVVTLARPEIFERRPTWGAKQRAFTAIHLEPLPEAAMRELLDGIVPALPDELARRVLQRAEGIPLYAVETVRMLLDTGRLVRDRGRVRLAGPIVDLEVPETLHALVASRLDGLQPADRALLQDAAVLGQTFTIEAVAGIEGTGIDEASERLDRLVDREVLAHDLDPRSPERGQYGFVQALMRDVARSTLSRRDLRARHLAAARYFESLATEEVAGILASHYLDAYRASPDAAEREATGAQARVALRAAADRAAALHSHDLAIGYLRDAIEITADVDERDALAERLGRSAAVMARYDLVRSTLEPLIERRAQKGDRLGVARVAAELGDAFTDADDVGSAERTMEAGLAQLEPPELDEPDGIVLRIRLARALMIAEKSRRALAILEPALEAAERLDLIEPVVDALITKGALVDELGRPIEGRALLHGARMVAQANALVNNEIRSLANLAAVTLPDDPVAAHESGRLAHELAQRIGNRAWFFGTISWSLQPESVDFEVALSRVEDARRLGPSGDSDVVLAVWSVLPLALLGRFDDLAAQFAVVARDTPTRPDATFGQRLFPNFQLLFEGRYEEAADGFVRAFDSPTWIRMLWANWPVRAAMFAGRLGHADRVAELVAAEAFHGRWVDSIRAEVGGVTAALGGRRDDARALLLTALRLDRDLRLELDVAWVGMELMLALGPDDPDARAAAADAREIVTRRGSPTMLTLLDDAVARRSPASRPTPHRAPPAGRGPTDSPLPSDAAYRR